MKRVFISKNDAVRIAGSKEELQRAVRQARLPYSGGEIMLVRTGAKLFATHQGAVRRYGIYGYSPNGQDVQEILDALKSGEDNKLRW